MYREPFNTPFSKKPAPILEASNGVEKSQEARGIELMAQRDNLLYEAAHAYTPESRGLAIGALHAWHEARTEADWHALKVAELGTGAAGRRAFVERHAEPMPLGQRR